MIDLAVIGLGGVGRFESDICASDTDVNIVAGADPAADARHKYEIEFSVPVYKDYNEMLVHESLDAIIVTTPHTQHYDPVCASLEQNLDVFVEKPMTTDIGEAISLVDLADDRQRVLQVGYQRRFHPVYRKIKRLIDAGKLGQVHTLNCYLGQDWISQIENTWRTQKSLSGGGQLYDSGTHLLDTLLWISGTEPQTVASSIDCLTYNVDVNSAIAATLNRDGHTVVANISITGDGTSAGRPEEAICIWGTEGRLVYENDTLSVYDKSEDDRESPREIEVGPVPSVREITNQELTHFFGAVRDEHESAVPGKVGLAVTAMTESIYRSDKTGRRIDVESMVEQYQTDVSLS